MEVIDAYLIYYDGEKKYYGTDIAIEVLTKSSETATFMFSLWNDGNGYPSIRELRSWNSEKEFMDNKYNSHFESKLTYELACDIVKKYHPKGIVREVKK